MEYRLVMDDDFHWYLIPADKREEALKWFEGEYERSPQPEWMERIDSPSTVVFPSYRISYGI